MAGVVITDKRIIAASQDERSYVSIKEYGDQRELPRKIHEALQGLPEGRSSVVIAMPCQRSEVYWRQFAPGLDQARRVKMVRNDVDPSRFTVDMRSSLSVAMQPFDKSSALVGIAPKDLIEFYLHLAKESHARLTGLEWEAFAWQRLLRGDDETPATVQADAVIVGTPFSASAIVFDDPVPHVRVFEMTGNDWYGLLSDFFTEIVTRTVGRVAPQRIAMVGDFSETTMNQISQQLLGAVVFPVKSPVSDDPFAPLALALDSDVRFDFRTALSKERLGALFHRERGLLTAVGLSSAAALALGLGYGVYLNHQVDFWATQVAIHEKTFDGLDKQRKADELRIGGDFGDISPYLATIVNARDSGAQSAIQMQQIGNIIGVHSGLTALTNHMNNTLDLTLATTSVDEAQSFFRTLQHDEYAFRPPQIDDSDDVTKFTAPPPSGPAATAPGAIAQPPSGGSQ